MKNLLPKDHLSYHTTSAIFMFLVESKVVCVEVYNNLAVQAMELLVDNKDGYYAVKGEDCLIAVMRNTTDVSTARRHGDFSRIDFADFLLTMANKDKIEAFEELQVCIAMAMNDSDKAKMAASIVSSKKKSKIVDVDMDEAFSEDEEESSKEQDIDMTKVEFALSNLGFQKPQVKRFISMVKPGKNDDIQSIIKSGIQFLSVKSA